MRQLSTFLPLPFLLVLAKNHSKIGPISKVDQDRKYKVSKLGQKILAEVRKVKEDQADIKTNLKDADAWIKPAYNNLSPAGRTELKTAVFMAKDDFPAGTLLRLRENTAIKFSKSPIANNEEESALKKAVTCFAGNQIFLQLQDCSLDPVQV